MRGHRLIGFVVLPVAGLVFMSLSVARDLTLEDRVKAQEAIERVYYSHQIGATKPFEDAAPRETLEKKVNTYLEQTIALEKFWKTRVTAEMLRAELERMARQTRMPERLRELFAALGQDTFLIQETLVRQVLVDRLAHNFFAYDRTIHAEALEEAEAAREALVSGVLDLRSSHPRRSDVEVRRKNQDAGEGPGLKRAEPPRDVTGGGDEQLVSLDAEAFAAWREQYSAGLEQIPPISDERDAYVVRVLLEEEPDHARAAVFTFPKMSYDVWWQSFGPEFDVRGIPAVAGASDLRLLAVGSDCPPYDAWSSIQAEAPSPRGDGASA